MSIEILKFLVVGVTAVVVDSAVYAVLYSVVGAFIAKGISFISGSIISYTINKLWTFGQRNNVAKEVLSFFILYAFTLISNVSVNSAILYFFPSWIFFAFICATGTSTVLNFLGMKFWVFKSK